MFLPFPSRYKIPLLISLLIGLAYLALTAEGQWLNAILAFIGAVLGVFLLDFEYIIQAYIVDPLTDSSLKIKEYLSNRRVFGLIKYLDENEYNIGELSIRSAVFQVLFTLMGFYVVFGSRSPFIICLSLSVLANLIYIQMMELNKTSTLKRWFWIYDGELTKSSYNSYIGVMLLVFCLLFYFVS